MTESKDPWQTFKVILKKLFLQVSGGSQAKDPVITWEEKVEARKQKTSEAKKAWEERKRSSIKKPIGDFNEASPNNVLETYSPSVEIDELNE